jgi:hypothetical protein
LVKIPEVQKQTNEIDCGLYAIANAVELCFTSFSGGGGVVKSNWFCSKHKVT